MLASTTDVNNNVGGDHFGAKMKSRTLGGRSLQVTVHSWHDAFAIVRYVLRYSVAGNACTLPEFTCRVE